MECRIAFVAKVRGLLLVESVPTIQNPEPFVFTAVLQAESHCFRQGTSPIWSQSPGYVLIVD